MKCISIAPDVLVRELGDESVILDLKTERYLGLDAVGTRMWRLLMESGSTDSAYRELLKEYDVEPNRLEADLQQFVEKLLEHGLIKVEGTPGVA